MTTANDTSEFEHLRNNVDIFFIVINATIVFLMQAGFAFLEAGAVRSKNTTNILLKNLLDSGICAIVYWAFGYAFAYGKGGAFIGNTGFFGTFPETELHLWFFQMVFAATAATIVSGGVAERCEFVAYWCYSILLSAFVYPVITRWAWHLPTNGDVPGWLVDRKSVIQGAAFQDFAGSGVVHLCGGTAALWGVYMMGPRIGRFDANGKELKILGHSVPLTLLGGLILMFGFFAFNGGSNDSISRPGDGGAVGRSVVNTMMAGSSAAVTTVIIHKIYSGRRNCVKESAWSLLITVNGVLVGMVAICAGANVMAMWGAFVTGLVAAIIFYFSSKLMVKLKMDDPVDAVAVHFCGGIWGLIAAPLFDQFNGICVTGSKASFNTLAMNLIGMLCIMGWTSALCVPLFLFLKYLKLFRVRKEIEIKGLDIPKHAEAAYPPEAWGDGWGNSLIASSNGLQTLGSQHYLGNKVNFEDTISQHDLIPNEQTEHPDMGEAKVTVYTGN